MKRSNPLLLTIAILVTALICGCQSAPKGPSDEELIANLLTEWQAAVTGKDMDRMMAVYSESYKGQRGEDKSGVRSFMEQAMSAGYLDGMQIDTSGAQTVITEGKATVGPVSLSTAMGAVTMTLDLAKEETGWLIIGSQSQR